MKKFSIFSSTILGLLTGLFVITSQFTIMDHDKWLTMHNSLILFSIIICGLIGFRSKSMKVSIIQGGQFVLIFMTLYISSYIISTTVFLEQLEWIPFFHKDYTYHGYKTVKEYLSTGNNHIELLKLQLLSLGISSLIYLASNALGQICRNAFLSWTLRTS